jgi:hypothetical protein
MTGGIFALVNISFFFQKIYIKLYINYHKLNKNYYSISLGTNNNIKKNFLLNALFKKQLIIY